MSSDTRVETETGAERGQFLGRQVLLDIFGREDGAEIAVRILTAPDLDGKMVHLPLVGWWDEPGEVFLEQSMKELGSESVTTRQLETMDKIGKRGYPAIVAVTLAMAGADEMTIDSLPKRDKPWVNVALAGEKHTGKSSLTKLMEEQAGVETIDLDSFTGGKKEPKCFSDTIGQLLRVKPETEVVIWDMPGTFDESRNPDIYDLAWRTAEVSLFTAGPGELDSNREQLQSKMKQYKEEGEFKSRLFFESVDRILEDRKK